jgi:thymidylate synthase
MRIFKNCYVMAHEMDRELMVQGITVPVKHYQNQKLDGDDQLTKELIGVSFLIAKPLQQRKEMLIHLFKDEADKIEAYCKQEFLDRISGEPLNPGNSYKIRQDLWQKFMVDNESKFDYSYSERLYWQWQEVVRTLKDDKHTRQAVMSIWEPKDLTHTGGDTRIPCSLTYSFLIRNNRLHTIYYMRSNDALSHYGVDIWIAAEIGQWIIEQIQDIYPEVKPGPLVYFCNSFHAYQWDMKSRIVF